MYVPACKSLESATAWNVCCSVDYFLFSASVMTVTVYSPFSLPEVLLIKERFAKLLLGDDPSGGSKGCGPALSLANAITSVSGIVLVSRTMTTWRDSCAVLEQTQPAAHACFIVHYALLHIAAQDVHS